MYGMKQQDYAPSTGEQLWLVAAAKAGAELTRGGVCHVDLPGDLWDVVLADGRRFERTQLEESSGSATKIKLVASAYGEISIVTRSEIVSAMKVL